MSRAIVRVRELAAWGFDDCAYRPSIEHACVCGRPAFAPQRPLVAESDAQRDGLQLQATRPDLLDEMQGLHWSLDMVDLREVLAFQRRLYFNDSIPQHIVPSANDWPGLLQFCFPPPVPAVCDSVRREGNTLVLSSANPNLHLRMSNDRNAPMQLHGGGPFLEVAQYRDRWFLRDGYHRAYALLQKGVSQVPAVIVHARTLAELGATRPCFFAEDVLFSADPPRVTDFLDDLLTLHYDRPALIKTLRITVDESFAPEAPSGESS
jgi:hypothetical protein